MWGLLNANSLPEMFDAIVVSSEVGWKKPSVEIYRRAIDELHVHFSECIFVANEEEKDLWQASHLGMTTILFTPVERDDRDVLHDQDVALMLRHRLTGEVSCRASSPCELRHQLESLLAS
jgi:FMN phosphatase YigB (HAD superfamily)